MADTKIEYCDRVLEVTGGCTKFGPGCQNCWAIKEVWRMAHNPLFGDKWKGLVEKKNGVLNWTGKIKCFEDALTNKRSPLHRKKPTTYFVDSKADLFHPKVPFSFVNKIYNTMWYCQQHTFLLLTKRIDRAAEYFSDSMFSKPQPNVHLGVSISTQAEADEKIPILLQIPAAVRFLSIEPMLGPLDLAGTDKSRMGKTGYLANYFIPFFCNHCGRHISKPPTCITSTCRYCGGHGEGHRREKSIHGVILGGESGPGARPMHPDWVRNIRDQCVAANVPLFFKQWGKYFPDEQFEAERKARHGSIMLPWSVSDKQIEKIGGQIYYRVGKKKAGHLLDGKEWRELPK